VTRKRSGKRIFRSGAVRKLLEDGGKDLSDDERALLLALAEVEADRLTERERAALEKLKAQVKGYDTEELSRAVAHMVTAPPREGAKLEWPELKKRSRSKKNPQT